MVDKFAACKLNCLIKQVTGESLV